MVTVFIVDFLYDSRTSSESGSEKQPWLPGIHLSVELTCSGMVCVAHFYCVLLNLAYVLSADFALC